MEKVKTVDWTEACKEHGTGGNGQFLKLKSGNSYRVRFVSHPYRFCRLYRNVDSQTCTAICEEEMKDCYPHGVRSAQRLVAYAIDRSDGQIKILEGPVSVFRPVGIHASIVQQKPDDPKNGSDYMIKVTGAGIRTRYEVAAIKETPLTPSEKASEVQEPIRRRN
jgi:hypothetical protein